MRPGDSGRSRLPKGVEALERPRGGRAYRATLRRGKGVVVHLGLYETPWLAGLAHATAAHLLGRDAPPMDVPADEQPTAEQVRELTARVRGRLKLDAPARSRRAPENPPQTEDLLTFFEVTVVGFWRGQSSSDDSDHPDAGLDAAAGRLASAASLLFWSRASGHPDPLDAMTELLSRRLDQAFRRPDLTRELLNDDGDDPFRVARWLVMPDGFVFSAAVGAFVRRSAISTSSFSRPISSTTALPRPGPRFSVCLPPSARTASAPPIAPVLWTPIPTQAARPRSSFGSAPLMKTHSRISPRAGCERRVRNEPIVGISLTKRL